MEWRIYRVYKSIRSKVDLDGTFKDDTAKFQEKLISSTIFGASAGRFHICWKCISLQYNL